MWTTNTSVRVLLWLSAISLASCPFVKINGGGLFRLQILHTNDMHSHFEEYNKCGLPCTKEDSVCYGGFPRVRYAVLQKMKEVAKYNEAADGTLFLNAGDTFQGTAFYSILKWKVVADLLQDLDIDVMSLGNHEFDDGVNDLNLFLQNISTPVVACNLDLSEEPSLAQNKMLKKSIVLTISNRKIGIIGYLTPDTVNLSKVGKVKFEDEVPAIQREARRLISEENVNIIIALGHSGFDTDVKIAQEVTEVDVVVGGHSNKFLYSGIPPDSEKATGAYPFCVKNPDTGRKVPVVQAFHATKYLGQLFVEFDDNGDLIRSYGNPILLDSSIIQHGDTLIKVNNIKKNFEEITKQIVGKTSVYLNGYGEFCRLKECNFGNFVTDAFVHYNIRHSGDKIDFENFWTDAPIALQQGGGIQDDIDNLANNGDISMHQLIIALPFGISVGKVKILGSGIYKAIENAFMKYNGRTPRGEFLQVSGIKAEIDLSKPGGQRVKSIRVRLPDKFKENEYEKLVLNKTYTVLMNSYMWAGGDGFTFTKTGKFHAFGKSDLDIVQEQIKLNSPIAPQVENRIILTNIDKIRVENSYSSTVQKETIIYKDMNC